jgi:prolipoprotein diacylglyceryltransferase
MQFFLILLIFCFVIFLFCIYLLSTDDVVFLRKGITTEQVFDVAFIGTLFGLLISRLFYVVFHFSLSFLNPLVFILFPYFNGLSLCGGVVGLMLASYFFAKRRKMPVGRILDFFAIALLCTLQFAQFFNLLFLLLAKKQLDMFQLIITVVYICIFLFFAAFLLPFHRSGQLREGTMSLLFLILFSVLSVVTDIMARNVKLFWYLGYESFAAALLFLVAVFYLMKQERVFIWLQKKLFLS